MQGNREPIGIRIGDLVQAQLHTLPPSVSLSIVPNSKEDMALTNLIRNVRHLVLSV